MPEAATDALMAELAGYPGIHGCALVDAETGMVWHHAGPGLPMEQLGEAAIEFWRVPIRLTRHFQAMGALQSAAYSFENQVIALFPCAQRPMLVLVCVAAKGAIDWRRWGEGVTRLKVLLETHTV
jgi:hypothetical protein